jgi:hypothetical protein
MAVFAVTRAAIGAAPVNEGRGDEADVEAVAEAEAEAEAGLSEEDDRRDECINKLPRALWLDASIDNGEGEGSGPASNENTPGRSISSMEAAWTPALAPPDNNGVAPSFPIEAKMWLLEGEFETNESIDCTNLGRDADAKEPLLELGDSLVAPGEDGDEECTPFEFREAFIAVFKIAIEEEEGFSRFA